LLINPAHIGRGFSLPQVSGRRVRIAALNQFALNLNYLTLPEIKDFNALGDV
jgi:hypothetical protein